MPKVLISDKMSPLAAEIFTARGVEVDVKTGLEPEALKAIIADYDGLAVRSATKATAEIIAAAAPAFAMCAGTLTQAVGGGAASTRCRAQLATPSRACSQ